MIVAITYRPRSSSRIIATLVRTQESRFSGVIWESFSAELPVFRLKNNANDMIMITSGSFGAKQTLIALRQSIT